MKRATLINTAYAHYSYLNTMLCRLLDFLPPLLRKFAFKLLLKEYGSGSYIDYGFKFRYGKKISIGKHVSISTNCELYPGFLAKESSIRIGDGVTIGPGVIMVGAGHDPKTMSDVGGPISLESGAYVGARTLIRYGVTIGENSTIAAHSVLTKSVDPNMVFIQKK
jgi:acetyltransferase-like isoleucine patch superfamily enzyme